MGAAGTESGAPPGIPGDPDKKLEAIRAAAKHEFPVSDIEKMLAEIEQGYGSSESL